MFGVSERVQIHLERSEVTESADKLGLATLCGFYRKYGALPRRPIGLFPSLGLLLHSPVFR